MMSYPTELDGLRWEKDEAKKAGYLIFDLAPMNTVSFKARSQIAAIIEAMDEDPHIRVIVIRGANGVYSSGGDIAGFLKVGRDGMHDLHWNIAAPERANKPVIAAIEDGRWASRSSLLSPQIFGWRPRIRSLRCPKLISASRLAAAERYESRILPV